MVFNLVCSMKKNEIIKYRMKYPSRKKNTQNISNFGTPGSL